MAVSGGLPVVPVRPAADGALRVVVVADTHSRIHPGAVAHIAAMRPDAILHGGDIGELGVLDELAQVAPVIAVRGNIDGRAYPDEQLVDLGPEGRVVRVLLTHIAVQGPKLRAAASRRAKELGATLVVCGHSHVPFIGQHGDVAIFNPGSVGPRRFSLPIVFGVLELRADGLHLGHVDAETGAPWAPP